MAEYTKNQEFILRQLSPKLTMGMSLTNLRRYQNYNNCTHVYKIFLLNNRVLRPYGPYPTSTTLQKFENTFVASGIIIPQEIILLIQQKAIDLEQVSCKDIPFLKENDFMQKLVEMLRTYPSEGWDSFYEKTAKDVVPIVNEGSKLRSDNYRRSRTNEELRQRNYMRLLIDNFAIPGIKNFYHQEMERAIRSVHF